MSNTVQNQTAQNTKTETKAQTAVQNTATEEDIQELNKSIAEVTNSVTNDSEAVQVSRTNTLDNDSIAETSTSILDDTVAETTSNSAVETNDTVAEANTTATENEASEESVESEKAVELIAHDDLPPSIKSQVPSDGVSFKTKGGYIIWTNVNQLGTSDSIFKQRDDVVIFGPPGGYDPDVNHLTDDMSEMTGDYDVLSHFWGDPHVNENEITKNSVLTGTDWHFGDNSTFVLPDGTRIGVNTAQIGAEGENINDMFFVRGLYVQNGDDLGTVGLGYDDTTRMTTEVTDQGEEFKSQIKSGGEGSGVFVWSEQANSGNGGWAVRVGSGGYKDIQNESWEKYSGGDKGFESQYGADVEISEAAADTAATVSSGSSFASPSGAVDKALIEELQIKAQAGDKSAKAKLKNLGVAGSAGTRPPRSDLTEAEIDELLAKAQAGDEQAREKLKELGIPPPEGPPGSGQLSKAEVDALLAKAQAGDEQAREKLKELGIPPPDGPPAEGNQNPTTGASQLDQAEIDELLAKAQAGDEQAREKLIELGIEAPEAAPPDVEEELSPSDHLDAKNKEKYDALSSEDMGRADSMISDILTLRSRLASFKNGTGTYNSFNRKNVEGMIRHLEGKLRGEFDISV